MLGPITVEKVLFFLKYRPPHQQTGGGMFNVGGVEGGESDYRAFERRYPGQYYITTLRYPWKGTRTQQLFASADQLGAIGLQRANNTEFEKFLLGESPYKIRLLVSDIGKRDLLSREEVERRLKDDIQTKMKHGSTIAPKVRLQSAASRGFVMGDFYRKATPTVEVYTLYDPTKPGRARSTIRSTKKPLGQEFHSTIFGPDGRPDPHRAVKLAVVYRIQLHAQPVPGLGNSPRMTARVGKHLAKQAHPEGKFLNPRGEERWVAMGAKMLPGEEEWRYDPRRKKPLPKDIQQRRVTYVAGKGIRPLASSRNYTVRPLPLQVYASNRQQAIRRMARKLARLKEGSKRVTALKIENMWKSAGREVMTRRKWDQYSRTYRQTPPEYFNPDKFTFEEIEPGSWLTIPKRFSVLKPSCRVY